MYLEKKCMIIIGRHFSYVILLQKTRHGLQDYNITLTHISNTCTAHAPTQSQSWERIHTYNSTHAIATLYSNRTFHLLTVTVNIFLNLITRGHKPAMKSQLEMSKAENEPSRRMNSWRHSLRLTTGHCIMNFSSTAWITIEGFRIESSFQGHWSFGKWRTALEQLQVLKILSNQNISQTQFDFNSFTSRFTW